MSTTPPAFSKALAVSYSQLVPGNIGMNILGFAIETEGFILFLFSNLYCLGVLLTAQ